jgi:hypothetical protein
VGRQIRLIEQAIKEQEASLALGTREGAQALPVVSEVAVPPRWQREQPRATLSPVMDDVEIPPEEMVEVETEESLQPVTLQTKKGRKGRKNQGVVQKTRTGTLKLRVLPPPAPSNASYCYCHSPDDGTEVMNTRLLVQLLPNTVDGRVLWVPNRPQVPIKRMGNACLPRKSTISHVILGSL